jgi:hypothetical protein
LPELDSYLLFDHEGRTAILFAEIDEIKGGDTVFFTGPGCTGDAYMQRHDLLQPLAHVGGNEVWYPDTTATLTSPLTQSQKDWTDVCTDATQSTQNSVPAYNFTLPTYTPPFHVEPEACFTPPDPDPEQIINGCVKDKNGSLRIVADPADCTPRETPISWVGQ